MAIRGRAAERAVGLACVHYRRASKADISKQATGMRRVQGGWTHTTRASIDYKGQLAGGGFYCCEVKEHGGASFPLNESTISTTQRNALDVASKMGGECWLIIDLPAHSETYAVTWATVQEFMRAPYRHSLSLQWLRAHGFICKASGRGTSDFTIWFLDYRKHDLHAGAYLAEAADRARSPIVDLDKPVEGNSERVVMTKEQRLAGVRNAIAAYRPKKKGLWGK